MFPWKPNLGELLVQLVIFTILVPGHAEFNLWLCNLCHDNANKGLQNLVSEFWYFASRFPQSYLRKFITKYLKQKKSNFQTFIGSFTCNHSFYGIYNNHMTLISRRRRNCTAQNFVISDFHFENVTRKFLASLSLTRESFQVWRVVQTSSDHQSVELSRRIRCVLLLCS